MKQTLQERLPRKFNVKIQDRITVKWQIGFILKQANFSALKTNHSH